MSNLMSYLIIDSAHPTKIYLLLTQRQLAEVVRHATHLSSNRLELNSTSCPFRVIAYVLSALSPLPQATAQKSLFRSSPNMALRPISGIGCGSLYCASFHKIDVKKKLKLIKCFTQNGNKQRKKKSILINLMLLKHVKLILFLVMC